MATFVGFTTGGIPGSVVATLGLVAPSVVIILIIARILEKFRSNKTVDAAFYGLRPCSIGLIAAAGLLVVKIALFNLDLYEQTHVLTDALNLKAILLTVILLVATRCIKPLKKLHPIFFILASAVVGILFRF